MSQTRPKRVPRAVREQQMLDAAVEVFARHGYHATAVDEIAERAGISKPMVYLYFGSKEELFTACLRREAGRLMANIAGAVGPDEEPRDQLWHALRAFFGFVSEHRGAWSVLYRQARNQGGPFAAEAQQMRRDTVDLVARLLTQTRPPEPVPDEVDAASHALVGACESLADWMIDHPDADPEITAERVRRFVWPGLSAMMDAERS